MKTRSWTLAVAAALAMLLAAPTAAQRDPIAESMFLDPDLTERVDFDTFRYGASHEETASVADHDAPAGGPLAILLPSHEADRETYWVDTRWLTSLLHKNGYVVATFDVRGDTNTPGPEFAARVAHGIAAVVAKADRYTFDAGRIVLIAPGWNAQTAALLGIDPSYLREAGVDFAALKALLLPEAHGLDLRAAMAEAPGHKRKWMRKIAADDDGALAALSPIEHAAAPNVPHLLLLPLDRDTKMVAASEAFAAAVRAGGSEAEVQPVARSRDRLRQTYLGHPDHPQSRPILDFLDRASR